MAHEAPVIHFCEWPEECGDPAEGPCHDWIACLGLNLAIGGALYAVAAAVRRERADALAAVEAYLATSPPADAALVEVVTLRHEIMLWKRVAAFAIKRGADAYGRGVKVARAFWRKRDALRREVR